MERKIASMKRVIEESIPPSTFDGTLKEVEMRYKDIRLDVIVKGNKCIIEIFLRNNHLVHNPTRRLLPAIKEFMVDGSDPGDGAIFLALFVIHCNSFKPIQWKGVLSQWWFLENNICGSILNGCKQDGEYYLIDNTLFLQWAKRIVPSVGGRKRKTRKYKAIF